MIKILNSEPSSSVSQEQLIDLMKETPVPGAVAYHYERPTGYQPYAKVQGTHFQLWEARENDLLLGFTQITFDQVVWNEAPVTVSYSGDTRVSLKARGRKVSDSLIQAACNQNVPVFGAVLGSNKMVLEKKLSDWDSLGIHFKEFAKLKAILFRPMPIKSRSSGIFCRPAQEADLPAMYFLWKIYSKTRNLPRYFKNLDDFSNSYFQTPGISLEQTFLVYDGITLIAMLSVWDQSKIRRLVVDQKNVWMKLASQFLSIPEPGEELKVHYSFQHAFLPDHKKLKQSILALIAKARTSSHHSGAHFFSMGLDEKDPIFSIVQKNAFAVNTANIILDSRGNEEFATSDKPLHLEVGLG